MAQSVWLLVALACTQHQHDTQHLEASHYPSAHSWSVAAELSLVSYAERYAINTIDND